MRGDDETKHKPFVGMIGDRPVYIPKDITCPFHVGERCIGSYCGRFLLGPNVCSDVAMATALVNVAANLADLSREVPELWKTIIAIYGQMYDTLKNADDVLKGRRSGATEG